MDFATASPISGRRPDDGNQQVFRGHARSNGIVDLTDGYGFHVRDVVLVILRRKVVESLVEGLAHPLGCGVDRERVRAHEVSLRPRDLFGGDAVVHPFPGGAQARARCREPRPSPSETSTC